MSLISSLMFCQLCGDSSSFSHSIHLNIIMSDLISCINALIFSLFTCFLGFFFYLFLLTSLTPHIASALHLSKCFFYKRQLDS